jgi:hypothetical protein
VTDWLRKTEGVWAQDFPRKLQGDANASSCDFEEQLAAYLTACGGVDVGRVRQHDYRAAVGMLVRGWVGGQFRPRNERGALRAVRTLGGDGAWLPHETDGRAAPMGVAAPARAAGGSAGHLRCRVAERYARVHLE